MTKVSIIVPFYNTVKSCGTKDYLLQNIDKLLNQTYQDIEIIYIDNNSKDETIDIIRKITQADKRVNICQEPQAGVSNARNKGIEVASGDYITFIDSDDFVSKDYIEKAVHAFKGKDLDVLIGQFTSMLKDGSPFTPLRRLAKDKYGDKIEDIYPAIECCHNLFFKTSFIKENNILFNPDIKIGEDNLFNISAILKAENVAFFDSDLYFYQIIPTSSANVKSDKYLTFLKAYDLILEMGKEKYGYINDCAIWYLMWKFKGFLKLSKNRKLFFTRSIELLKKHDLKERPKIKTFQKIKHLFGIW